jgi:GNAT superfamily N-acetyltransferase
MPMFELDRARYTAVLPLLADAKQVVVPFAVCEGYQPGRVFADDCEHPASAWIWLPCGYLFLAGEPQERPPYPAATRLLVETLAPAWRAAGESGFVLVPFSAAWETALADILWDQPHERIYRRPFVLNLSRFAEHGDWAAHIPPGLVMCRVDETLAEHLGGMPTWASAGDFLARGIGYCLMAGDEIASACTTVFGAATRVEIDVHTAEPHRRQGLATMTAAALIEDCLRTGRQPNWECFWDNEASCALATRLGFEAQDDYPVVYWEPAPAG